MGRASVIFAEKDGARRDHSIENAFRKTFVEHDWAGTMIRLTVLYGHPDDTAEFDRYYHDVHIPIAKKMKGLKGWTIGKCQSADTTELPAYYMIVGLYAESRADMEAILESPEGQATVADVANFATGGATFLYDDEKVMIPYSLE